MRAIESKANYFRSLDHQNFVSSFVLAARRRRTSNPIPRIKHWPDWSIILANHEKMGFANAAPDKWLILSLARKSSSRDREYSRQSS